MSTDYSSDGLLLFLRDATLAGRLTPSAAKSRRAAAQTLFAELSDSESADLRTLDIDALKSRFLDTQGGRLRAEVVELYAERLRWALEDYFRFVASPNQFVSSSAAASQDTALRRDELLPKTSQERALEAVRLTAPRQRSDVIPIPLKADRVVYLHGLPVDLTPQEARKIARVVEALATEAEDAQ
ncbi:MAG: hypothetical protein ACI8RN_000047 [Glaciecola sp.]|jgi:hypothetical protein|uniref:hypothetical protein n=1 Tax=Congregibacter sp. TaxID=2744308 RepID=UPI0039E59B89